MASSGVSRAQENRRIRQEALREQLKASQLITQVVERTNKMANLDKPLDANEVNRLKGANDSALALLKKVLPDLKATEIEGNLTVSHEEWLKHLE